MVTEASAFRRDLVSVPIARLPAPHVASASPPLLRDRVVRPLPSHASPDACPRSANMRGIGRESGFALSAPCCRRLWPGLGYPRRIWPLHRQFAARACATADPPLQAIRRGPLLALLAAVPDRVQPFSGSSAESKRVPGSAIDLAAEPIIETATPCRDCGRRRASQRSGAIRCDPEMLRYGGEERAVRLGRQGGSARSSQAGTPRSAPRCRNRGGIGIPGQHA